MADPSTCLPLTPDSIIKAHAKIRDHIHKTPVLTSRTLDRIVSAQTTPDGPTPRVRLFFKCENFQRIGAFKARGAFHALLHLIDELGLDEVKKRGVCTHSSGNHAQALAMAASSFNIPAYIVMPTISTSSKIAGTKAYTEHVIFSGSTGAEREAVLAKVMEEHNAILIPPYDHPDIMLGQGTSAFELDEQYRDLQAKQGGDAAHMKTSSLNMVITPCGGGGLLSGTTVYFSDKPETYVFGAEPSYQGADDAKRGLEASPPIRITSVSTLTIADGLRTYVGENPWGVLTGGSEKKPKFLQGVRSVSEEEIKDAMKLLLERLKVFVEPSACVGLAALLYDQEFRQWIQKTQGESTWDIGVTLSGGNTTVEAILGIFGNGQATANEERQQGTLGQDGRKFAKNVAG